MYPETTGNTFSDIVDGPGVWIFTTTVSILHSLKVPVTFEWEKMDPNLDFPDRHDSAHSLTSENLWPPS